MSAPNLQTSNVVSKQETVKKGILSEHKDLLLSLQKTKLNCMTDDIVQLLLDSPMIYEDSYLPYNDEFSDGDYIDQVSPTDLKRPIMWGIDPYERLYISIRKKTQKIGIDGIKIVGSGKLNVETFFQRYTENYDVWTSGGGGSGIRIVQNRLKENEFDHLKNFLQKGFTTLSTSLLPKSNPVSYRIQCS
jgi:hypothetical protein